MTNFMKIITLMTTSKMKHIVARLLLVALLVVGTAASANADKKKDSDKPSKSEMLKEIQEFKIKFLIQEAEIEKDKQAEFIKLYTEMENARGDIFKSVAKQRKALKKGTHTDEEYLKVSENIADMKSREGAIEKSYYLQFKRLLTPKQLYNLKRAELKFAKKLMEMKGKEQGK